MPQSNSRLKAIVSELERRRTPKPGNKLGNQLVAMRLNEYVPPPVRPTVLLTRDSGHPVVTTTSAEPTVNVQSQSVTRSVNIICERCGRCRCANCRVERPLPLLTINGESCTVDALIDTVTCVRLVRSAAKRAGKRYEADQEESVRGRAARWSVVSALSVLLPCVACYWPLRGVRAAATQCYNSPAVRNNVCRCRQSSSSPSSRGHPRGSMRQGERNLEPGSRARARARPGSVSDSKSLSRSALRASFSNDHVHRFVKASSCVDRTSLDQSVDENEVFLAELHADRSIKKLR